MADLQPPTPIDEVLRREIWRQVHANRARRQLVSRVMITICAVTLALSAVPLIALLVDLFSHGIPVLSASFFTSLPQSPSLLNPNATGGVSNAIVGTLALNLYAAVLAVPLGVLAGVYVAENTTKLASLIRIVSQTMSGAPSILMGLFAFSLVVKALHVGLSALAGSFALAVLVLPVVVISTELAVRNVPQTYREAGLALGARPHKVSLRIVLPSALTGIVTGVILAMSRSIGETAPVMLVIGGGYTNAFGLFGPVSALPLTIYQNAKSQWPSQRAQVWGIALVLVVVIFVLSLAARIWAARKQQGSR